MVVCYHDSNMMQPERVCEQEGVADEMDLTVAALLERKVTREL